jgi:hypothetical protein
MEARKQKVKKENKPMVVPLTSDYYHKIDRILGNLGKIPNWEIRKTKNLDPPNLDPSNLQILEPPGSCRLQDFLLLATGFANFEGPKSGNNWMSGVPRLGFGLV